MYVMFADPIDYRDYWLYYDLPVYILTNSPIEVHDQRRLHDHAIA